MKESLNGTEAIILNMSARLSPEAADDFLNKNNPSTVQ
jgi:hypothetical protein